VEGVLSISSLSREKTVREERRKKGADVSDGGLGRCRGGEGRGEDQTNINLLLLPNRYSGEEKKERIV